MTYLGRLRERPGDAAVRPTSGAPSPHAGRSTAAQAGYEERHERHRKPLLRKVASEHGRRLVSFSLIGFAVFAAGIGVQVLLVQVAHVPAVLAYVTQLVLSVQANFLAN